MTLPYHSITPIGGVHALRRDAEPLVAVGTVVLGTGNTTWIYGQATEAVTGTCTVNTTTFNITDAAGNHTAEAAFAANEYGWVRQTAPFQA